LSVFLEAIKELFTPLGVIKEVLVGVISLIIGGIVLKPIVKYLLKKYKKLMGKIVYSITSEGYISFTNPNRSIKNFLVSLQRSIFITW